MEDRTAWGRHWHLQRDKPHPWESLGSRGGSPNSAPHMWVTTAAPPPSSALLSLPSPASAPGGVSPHVWPWDRGGAGGGCVALWVRLWSAVGHIELRHGAGWG